MSSTPDTDEADAETAEVVTDERREALLEALTGELGDAIVASHLHPGHDLWVRVERDAWQHTGLVLRRELEYRYFNFLSAIDWLPSPFGREMDAEVDTILDEVEPPEPEPMEQGVTGGDTRFQLLARVNNTTEKLAVFVKCDLPDDDLAAPTWIPAYAGANWHEREAYEMFGIDFVGHPDLRKLYLPGGFEGNPLRKDYPLLARRVKPWPGIVDVEPMPGDDSDESDESGEAS